MNQICDVDKLLEVLPHGSGVDYDWDIDVKKNGNIYCHNAFHRLNENGYYDKVIPFTVRIFKHTKNLYDVLTGPLKGEVLVTHESGEIDFEITGRFRGFQDECIKDYLDEIFYYALLDAGVIQNKPYKKITIDEFNNLAYGS